MPSRTSSVAETAKSELLSLGKASGVLSKRLKTRGADKLDKEMHQAGRYTFLNDWRGLYRVVGWLTGVQG